MSSSTYEDPNFDKRTLKPMNATAQRITRLATTKLSSAEMLQLSKTLEIAAMEKRITKRGTTYIE